MIPHVLYQSEYTGQNKKGNLGLLQLECIVKIKATDIGKKAKQNNKQKSLPIQHMDRTIHIQPIKKFIIKQGNLIPRIL